MHVGQWPVFDGSKILPYVLKTIWKIQFDVILWILVPCDAKIYLITFMSVSDLYFMVQSFCLVSWRLFDGWMLYWRYWFSVTQTLTWNCIRRSVNYISRSIEFVLYIEDYLTTSVSNNLGNLQFLFEKKSYLQFLFEKKSCLSKITKFNLQSFHRNRIMTDTYNTIHMTI